MAAFDKKSFHLACLCENAFEKGHKTQMRNEEEGTLRLDEVISGGEGNPSHSEGLQVVKKLIPEQVFPQRNCSLWTSPCWNRYTSRLKLSLGKGVEKCGFFPKVCEYLFPFSFVYYNAYQTVNIYCNLQQINFPKSSQLVLWQKSVSDFPIVVKPWPFLLLFSVFSTSISLNTETEWPNRALSFALVVIEISLIPGPAGQKWRHASHHPSLPE